MTNNPAGIKEKYNDRRHIPQTRTIPKIKREKIAENKDKKTILCHFISPSVIANSNFRGKISSPTVAIANENAGFLRPGTGNYPQIAFRKSSKIQKWQESFFRYQSAR